ncbi:MULTISPECIES: dephospho-CoA kinase [Tepidiphilus]|uniref:dephospho-CoA kinase n=1 Tax=Tepidiphilus TaxID=203470 RepID=UPI00163DDF43|nr:MULTISPECIES: dephospho-CoA kinase [Tepidiphilus]
MSHPPFIIGLTGGIGSGKSAAAEHFARLGAAVVDTDAIAHELTAPGGAAIPALVAAFGPDILTPAGALDRAQMRTLAFSDPEVKRRLEAILHPLIRQESDARCRAATEAPYVVLVVPLLIEAGEDYRRRCQRIAVVDCPEEIQIARVRARSGLDEDLIRRIMAQQASRAERLAAADDILDNGGDLAQLHAQVEALDRLYRELARHAPP